MPKIRDPEGTEITDIPEDEDDQIEDFGDMPYWKELDFNEDSPIDKGELYYDETGNWTRWP